jgi:hypothetical protein
VRLGLATVAFALVIPSFALLGGCGYIGPPMPPALNIPLPVMDLSVTEVGDKIIVHFTPPVMTTDNLPVESLRAMTLYVGPSEPPFSRERWAATTRRYEVPLTATEYTLNANDWAGQDLVISIRTTGRTGKESDWATTYGVLTVGVPLLAPSAVKPANAPDAIALTWTGNAPRYRVLRAELKDPMPKLVQIAEVDAPEYVDQAIAEGARYQYVILGIGGSNRQSLPSEAVEFVPKDVFPPAVPMGLTAISGDRSVTLSWSRSPDDDLEGYNIFRAVDDGALQPLTQHVTLPAFTDTTVEAGRRYRYAVSAVDKSGNESGKSAEASAQ